MIKSNDSIVTLLGNVLNRLSTKQLIVTLLENVSEILKKKINDNDSIVTFLEDVSI